MICFDWLNYFASNSVKSKLYMTSINRWIPIRHSKLDRILGYVCLTLMFYTFQKKEKKYKPCRRKYVFNHKTVKSFLPLPNYASGNWLVVCNCWSCHDVSQTREILGMMMVLQCWKYLKVLDWRCGGLSWNCFHEDRTEGTGRKFRKIFNRINHVKSTWLQ